ncbi:NfeD family protein [Romboutsia lituseburensis]|uniref:Membrane protein implicated in regulation of membrane protease activity n=1 Tax=Romboutsia lituseburensis DSM 797 TaxID=1121325 RepID=A0A1G9SMA7_9FIRM|nr:NfeD family protein [Romboutsia lituseburensis]CEH32967.1 Nodulation efficiency protein D [Romboutsia lituseburensis]SDM36457.1 Membrane protein implicated in regulation of membrane protease activity [Romboutsia lituseburensis DSM 797]
MKLLWLIVAIIFGIAEAMTPSLTLIWFSIGALILIFLSTFIKSILIQVILFGIISVTLLIVATKIIVKKDENHQYDTNLQAIVKKSGVVRKDILPNETGIVVVENEEWSAISANNEAILENTEVEILKIEGVKLIVSKK